MNWVGVVFTIIKIAVILGFCLGVGGALTWNDRRMSAMNQDRVGPNRAAFVLPRWLAQGMFAGPALLAAIGVAYWGWGWLPNGLERATEPGFANAFLALFGKGSPTAFASERILITLELSVLVAWVALSVLTVWAVRLGPSNPFEKWLATEVVDPRRIFYAALALHVVGFLARFLVRGTEAAQAAKPYLFVAGPTLLALLLAASGLVAASKVPKHGFRLRLIGLLHTMADGLKMIFKEDFMPKNGDRLLHSLAPMIAIFPALVIFAVIPFGDVLCVVKDAQGATALASAVPASGVCTSGPNVLALPMQIASLDVGILFIFAIAGTGIIGAAIGGWASDNKYSLIGGLRAAGQMVSYEITLGLTLIGPFMIYSTLRLEDMVRWQSQNAWGIFVQPLAFLLFFIAAIAETKRIPFDLPEGESEIIGYFTEYSGMKFGMFFFSEYIEVVTSSALLVTLFLGGWTLPFLHQDGITIAIGDAVLWHYAMTHISVIVIGVIAFFAKVLAVCWLQVVIRWTLPRFRYDQLMRLCWRGLLPLSVANIMATGVLMLVIQHLTVPVQSALDAVADVTQLLVALALVAGAVAAARWLLRPVRRERRVLSTSAELTAKHGATPKSPMQA